MALLPRLTLRCSRCGRPREGVRHVCRSNSKRAATVRLSAAWTCPRCHKPGKFMGLGHTCKSAKGDYSRRKKAFAKSAKSTRRTASQGNRQRHDYAACPDPKNCQRTACVAYREGFSTGSLEGYDSGYESGYSAGLGQRS